MIFYKKCASLVSFQLLKVLRRRLSYHVITMYRNTLYEFINNKPLLSYKKNYFLSTNISILVHKLLSSDTNV